MKKTIDWYTVGVTLRYVVATAFAILMFYTLWQQAIALNRSNNCQRIANTDIYNNGKKTGEMYFATGKTIYECYNK